MKLQDIPKNSLLRIELEDGSIDLATFFHCDGLYSYCETSDNKPFHLSRFTPMKLVDNRYEIDLTPTSLVASEEIIKEEI